MDPCIVESANFHMHLHHQTLRTNLPACPDLCLVVSFNVRMPGARPPHRSYTFYYTYLQTAIALPYDRHWQHAAEHMILTAAGDDAPALDLAQLVGDFCAYSHAAFDRFRSLPGHFLFLSAVVDVAPDSPPSRFYFFPFPEAKVRVEQNIFNPVTLAGYRSDSSPLPIWSTIETVVFGGEAAGEDDRQSCCAVCLEEYEEGELLEALPCGHRFHSSCVTEWLRKEPTCPLCRRCVPEYNLFLKPEL